MKSSPLTLLLAACFASFLGCGGDEDAASSSSPDAGTDSGGTAGTAGSAGEAGSGGTAGSAGASGSGGTAGSAGASGSAGAAGSAGSSPACDSGSDCGSEVCDPATLTCAASTCDPSDYKSCAGFPQAICLEQDNGEGACYQDCTPFDGSGSCGADADCLTQSDDESLGLCYYTGQNTAGESCSPTDTGTDCVSGTVCVNFGSQAQPDRQCSTICQVFDDGPTGCPSGDLCMLPSVCLPASSGVYDDVAVGAACTLDDYLYCGNVGGRLTGTCDDAPSGGSELRCYAWCRLSQANDDCDAGYTCTDTDWDNGLGVCVQD